MRKLTTMSKLTNILAPLTVLMGLTGLAGNANSGDYVQVKRFGAFKAGYEVTHIHTEPMCVNETYQFSYRNDCGECCVGTGFRRVVREVITSQYTTTCIDWPRSAVAAPGNLLSAIGGALTPKDRCNPQIYRPDPRCCQPTRQPRPCDRVQPRGYEQIPFNSKPYSDPSLPSGNNSVPPAPPIPAGEIPPAPPVPAGELTPVPQIQRRGEPTLAPPKKLEEPLPEPPTTPAQNTSEDKLVRDLTDLPPASSQYESGQIRTASHSQR